MPFEAVHLSPADEKRIARDLSPPVAWPTLALAVVLPTTFWGLAALGFDHVMALWLCVPALTFLSYAHYTLVHESIHDNLVPGHPKLRWINTLVGWIGALGLTWNWPMLRRGHVLHHSHTNTDQDPDIDVKGTFVQLIGKWLAFIPFSLVPPVLYRFIAPSQHRKLEAMLRGSEILQASAVSCTMLALMVLAIATGHFAVWLFLLFIPTRCAGLLLQIFFSWLPHHPFERTERYLNTRISLWPGGTVLLLQQNLHLMHHLWPSVPFYNYGRLYRRLRVTLIAKGSPIQGLLVGRYARDLSRA